MRPQETRRYEDESFYFENHELVIDPDTLPEYYPEVTVLKGTNVVAYYFDVAEGEIRGSSKENSWTQKFEPGNQIVRVTTSYQEPVSNKSELLNPTYEFEGDVTDGYDIEFDDLLILQADSLSFVEGPGKVVLASASEPLPGEQGTHWELEGIITSDGKLISWGGDYQRWLVEMSLANRLIQDAVGYHTVNRELGITPSLVGSINVASGVKKYLEYLGERYDENFVPDQDLHMREDTIPGGVELTLEQSDRYRAKIP